jgi:hypothetical protein
MVQGINDKNSWVENTGDVDHWKMTMQDGKWGWKDDKSLDFDVSELNAAKGLSGASMIAAGDMTAEQIASLMSTAEITDESFIKGTQGLSIASSNAKKLIASLDAETKFNKHHEDSEQMNFDVMATTQNALMNNLNAGLLQAQTNGVVFKNPLEIDTTGLIGSGTSDNPYLPVRANADGKVQVFGYSGLRLTDNEMTKANSASFPAYSFAKKIHDGGDIAGSGNIVASESGSLSFNFNQAYGLRSVLTTDANAQYFNSHASSGSVNDYISTFGTQGVSLSGSSGSFKLSGIAAGSVIGEQGMTGKSVTGVHVDSEVYNNGDLQDWNKLFNSSDYSNRYTPDPYATNMTGYTSRKFDDPQLWFKVKAYSKSVETSVFDYTQFLLKNANNGPLAIQKERNEYLYNYYTQYRYRR